MNVILQEDLINKKKRKSNKKDKPFTIEANDIEYVSVTDKEDKMHLVEHIVRGDVLTKDEDISNEYLLQYSGDIRPGYKLCKNCGDYFKENDRCNCRSQKFSKDEMIQKIAHYLEYKNGLKVSINGKVIK